MRSALVWSALIALVITALSWAPVDLRPGPGLDTSWQAGLAMAAHRGLSFGDQVIFTYGPLGFLDVHQLWFRGLATIAFAYLVTIRFAVALAIFLSLRRTFPAALALVLAVFVTALGLSEPEAVATLTLLVLARTSDLRERHLLLVSGLAGAFAGMQLLMKVSVGLEITLLAVAFGLTLRRPLYALVPVAGCIILLLAGWLAIGQPLAALPNYAQQSEQIASGYTAAMSIAVAGLGWQGFAALLVLCFGLWSALQMTELADARTRWGVVALWAIFWFFQFKEGFVRHDVPHAADFFAATVGGVAAFRWRPTHRPVAFAGLAAAVTLALAAAGNSLGDVVNPTRSVHSLLGETHILVSGSRRRAAFAEGAAAIRQANPLDARALELVRDQTVALYPNELSAIWGYGLHWDPFPVLQSYSAFTSALDSTDAEFLRSSGAPQRILFKNETSIDGRVRSFDQPLATRTMLCDYTELYATSEFAVLGHSPDRCASTLPLGSVRAGWGEAVTVPRPPDGRGLVFVRVDGAEVSGVERVRGIIFKPDERFVFLDGLRYRLVGETARDGLPVQASTGYDYSSPFNVAVQASTIAVSKQGQPTAHGDELRFSFYLQTFTRRAGAA